METADNKINILQLVNGFAIGGAETKLLDLIQCLDKNKYRVYVASVGQGGPLQKKFEKYAEDLVVFPKGFAFDFSLVLKVADYMRKKNIQLVQTTLLYADLIGPIAAKLARVRHVISWETVSHGENDPLRTGLRHRLGYRLAMKWVSKIVAVSEETRASIIANRKIDSKKISVIYYGVDLDNFNISNNGALAKRKEMGISPDAIVIAVVARLAKVKGHKYLIEASRGVIEKFPNVKVIFVGDGPNRKKLQHQVKESDLASHYQFLGFRNDVQHLLKMVDIFVLPSLTEGMPNVILEAMACGKPVVASNVAGIPEIVVNGKTGYLVPPKNVAGLEKAILKMVANPKLRNEMGIRARQRIEQQFSMKNMVVKFEELYDSYFNKPNQANNGFKSQL